MRKGFFINAYGGFIFRVLGGILGFLSLLFSGETDNYYSLMQNLPDASELINKEFNERIELEILKINNDPKSELMECPEIAGEILKSFGVSLATDFESWIHDNGDIGKYPPVTISRKEFFRKSIYYERTWDLLHRYFDWMILIQIDPMINVGGVYIGLDKITHFTASGYLYYRKYMKAVNRGLSKEDAIYLSITYGIKSEKLLLGISSNGIFSYADLESNFQGMRFAIDLCDDENPVIKRARSHWVVDGNIDITKYVNPYWDESFNPCAGFHYRRPVLRENLQNYCPAYASEIVRNRFEFYNNNFEKSRNMEILDSLRTAGKIPDNRPNRFPSFCADAP